MKKNNAQKWIALASAVTLLAGLFCLPVAADEPPYNDTTLDWSGLCAQHQYDNDCDPECNVCGAQREVGDHAYTDGEDITCDRCGAYRIVIVTQPVDTGAQDGVTVKVPVVALGDGLTYTWYVKNATDSTYGVSSIKLNTYSVKMSDKASGRSVYCVVSDAHGNQVKTDIAVLYRPIAITKDLTTGYAKMGAKASVKVTAAGDGLTYTWYIKNSGASKYSKSSVTSATYSTTMSTAAKNRYVYCVVADKYGNSVKSKTVLLREAVSITTEPTTGYAKKNATAKVTVKASGDGLTYTWYVKNSGASKYTKSSVTTASYSVKLTSTTKNRYVYCIVKDKYGKTVQSKTVLLREAVSITTQPKTVTVKKNATAKVTVTASGDGLTYTWYYKNASSSKYTKVSGSKNYYSVKMTAAVKNRKVYCIVKDKYGKTVQTSTVTLKMK